MTCRSCKTSPDSGSPQNLCMACEIKALRCLVRDLLSQSCERIDGQLFSGFISIYAEAMRYMHETGMTESFEDRGMRIVRCTLKDAYFGYPGDASPLPISEDSGNSGGRVSENKTN